MAMKRRRLRIYEGKLGNWRAHGITDCQGYIVIDPRQRSRGYLNTLIHEVLHNVRPGASESWVRRAACRITRAVWEANYRKVAK